MKHLILILSTVLIFAQPAKADTEAFRDVIDNQLQAFKVDDFETAFSFASPTIREIFKTPERFGAMVKGGYPMVWRPDEVTFLGVENFAGSQWQTVMIRDQDGALYILYYEMQNIDGIWKINGVRLEPGPEKSA